MYTVRPRAVKRTQLRDQIEISSHGTDVPLKCDWPERWCTLPKDFEEVFERIHNFEVFEDDVFVVTFPKCGTTWVQEAAWLLMNDLNYEQAKEKDLQSRSVFMDQRGLYRDFPRDTIELAAKSQRPRLIKTHLPAHLIPRQIWPKKIKIIYCARNPKDVAVSFYHFHKGMGTWQGSITEFVEDFINDDLMYTPFWPGVLDFWHMRNQENVFFTTYEEMKRNLKGVLINLNRFLGKTDLSDENMEKLLQHLDFDKMKTNKKINPTHDIKMNRKQAAEDFEFMRRGVTGAYKDELSDEDQRKLNEWSTNYLTNEKLTENDIFGSIEENRSV